MGSELKTLKDLTKTTIMIPDLTSNCPCKNPCVPVVHIEERELKEMIIEWIKVSDKNREQWKYDKEHTNKLINDLCDYNEDGAINVLKHIFNIKQEETDGKD